MVFREPENFIFARSGNVKMIDFTFHMDFEMAKRRERKKTGIWNVTFPSMAIANRQRLHDIDGTETIVNVIRIEKERESVTNEPQPQQPLPHYSVSSK